MKIETTKPSRIKCDGFFAFLGNLGRKSEDLYDLRINLYDLRILFQKKAVILCAVLNK